MEPCARYLLFCTQLLWLIASIYGACDVEWEEATNGRCYRVLLGNSPYENVQQARQDCQQLGADMASIIDAAVQSSIYSSAQSTLPSGNTAAYIGLSDIREEGNFTWLNDTLAIFSNWQTSATLEWPEEELRDCVALYSSDSSWTDPNPVWMDVPCCFNPLSISAVVCEKPQDQNATIYDLDLYNDYCQGGCPSGWFKWNTTCYKFLNSSSLSMTYDARQLCLSAGADIGGITDEEVSQHIAMMANNTQDGPGEFYVSLNDQSNEGTFVHINETMPAIFSPSWTTDPATDENLNCVKVSSAGGNWQNDTTWTNIDCCTDQSVSWALCQRPETNPATPVDIEEDIFALACDTSACLSDPCVNGTCNERVLSYDCTCSSGFTGTNCETDIDDCVNDPCSGHGVCTDMVANFTCACDDGYGGYQCDVIDDYCLACDPCMNEASCDHVDGSPPVSECSSPASFECTCLAGYTGSTCETDINECDNVTCQNNGTCQDLVNDFLCNCPDNFHGDFCETEVVCQVGVTVGNATIEEESDPDSPSLNSFVRYRCLHGYKFPDMDVSKTIVCTETGWNDTLDNCERHCDVIPVVAHSSHPADASTVVGYTLNYTCDHGYRFPDNSTTLNTTCQANGNWTEENISDCEVVTCPELPVYPHQSLNHRNNTFNITVIFWCDVGYEIYDGTTARSIKCRADGEWSAELPTCDPIRCPVIDLPESSTRNTSDNTYNTYTRYWCDSGKRMLDGATYRVIKCDATGNWSDDVTACTNERCFPLPYVANATPDATDANHGDQRTLTCIQGHRFPTNERSRQMRCMTNNRWDPLLAACEPLYCDELSAVNSLTNCELDTQERLFGTVVTASCVAGHYFVDTTINTVVRECIEGASDNAVWDYNIADCEAVTCVSPPDIQNGVIDVSGPDYSYGDTAHYTCDENFKFIDGHRERTLVCSDAGNATGTWNLNGDVTCRVDRCVPVPEPANAVPNTTDTDWYTNVEYTCEQGYEWPNNRSTYHITCPATGNGQWDFSDIPGCDIKYCPEVPTMPNAVANDTATNYYDAHVTYTCLEGYKYFGDEEDESDDTFVKTMRCSHTQMWEPVEEPEEPMPECQIIHCPELPEVENATRDSNDTFYNVNVTYICLDGYQFQDSTPQRKIFEKDVRCQANETWTTIPGPCEVVFCPPVPTWNDGAQFNSTENEFESVIEYWCTNGYAFEDSNRDESIHKTSLCAQSKRWRPSIKDCVPLESIAASLQGKTYESEEAVSIGMVAITLVTILVVSIILLDLNKLYSDIKIMKSNIESMIEYRRSKNKVTDSNPSLKSSADLQA